VLKGDLFAFVMTAKPNAWSTATQDHDAWRVQLNTDSKVAWIAKRIEAHKKHQLLATAAAFYSCIKISFTIMRQPKIFTIFGDNIIKKGFGFYIKLFSTMF
jgi:hypothetical protein